MPSLTSSPSAETGRRLKAENRREQILQTALSLFTERGFEGVGMAEIAQAMQTSRPTIYTYFPSTEHILDALLDERLEHLPERLAPHLGHLGTGSDTAFAGIFSALLEERELLLLLNCGGGPYFRSRRKAFISAIESRLNLRELGLQKSAALGRQSQPLLLPIVLTLLTSMAAEQVQGGDMNATELAQVLDRFINGGIGCVLE